MENLDTLSKIFENLDLCSEILTYCSTNKSIRKICEEREIQLIIANKLRENANELIQALEGDIRFYEFHLDQPWVSGQQAEVAYSMGPLAEQNLPKIRKTLEMIEDDLSLKELKRLCSDIVKIKHERDSEMARAMGF